MNQPPPPIDFGPLEMALLGIGGLLGLVAFVCFVMIVVKMFQNNQTALGIISIVTLFCVGIGYLVALIFGWTKAKEWNAKGLMVAYTATLIGSLVLGGAGYGIVVSKMMKAIQNDPQFQQQIEDLQNQIEAQ